MNDNKRDESEADATCTDIPPDKVDQVVRNYEAEGAVVEKCEQDNGLWTVVVKFPW